MTRTAATFTFTFTGRKARGCLAVRLGSDVTIGRLRGSVRGLVAEAQETLLIWLSRAKITIIWHLMSILQLEKKLSAENRQAEASHSPGLFHRAKHSVILSLQMSMVPSANKTQLKLSYLTTLD